jgi:alkylresorcinol/alkylpyrone synthase
MDAPRILAVATAVPRHLLRQDEVKAWAGRRFDGAQPDMARLLAAFDHAGIETRYSCVPLSWYDAPHGFAEKNRLYIEHALDLLERAARRCLDEAGVAPAAVDAVVSASTSGIATPSLEARLAGRLGLRADVARLPLFGLGCAGGVLGLARAADAVRARPSRTVLFLVVELCGLTFRSNDRSKSNVIATVLFGDGAAAALLGGGGAGPAIAGAGEHAWPDTLDVMGWRIEDDGFGVLFSQDIPSIIRRDMRGAVDRYLAGQGLALGDVDGFVCHPGGAKVVAALEDAFGLPAGALRHTRAVLRDYGNMSAASVMFVLERVLAEGASGRYLVSALGPGFTAGFLTLEIP